MCNEAHFLMAWTFPHDVAHIQSNSQDLRLTNLTHDYNHTRIHILTYITQEKQSEISRVST